MKDVKKLTKDEYLYHNTEILLKKYRDVVWSIEVSAVQAQINFEIEMDCKLDEFLDMAYSAGMDVSGTKIQEQIRTLERNKKMLEIIDAAVNVLRKKQLEGEIYYWIIYYTYLSDKPMKRVEDIIVKVQLTSQVEIHSKEADVAIIYSNAMNMDIIEEYVFELREYIEYLRVILILSGSQKRYLRSQIMIIGNRI